MTIINCCILTLLLLCSISTFDTFSSGGIGVRNANAWMILPPQKSLSFSTTSSIRISNSATTSMFQKQQQQQCQQNNNKYCKESNKSNFWGLLDSLSSSQQELVQTDDDDTTEATVLVQKHDDDHTSKKEDNDDTVNDNENVVQNEFEDIDYVIVNGISSDDNIDSSSIDHPSYFTITSEPNGPSDSMVHTLTFTKLPGQDDDDDINDDNDSSNISQPEQSETTTGKKSSKSNSNKSIQTNTISFQTGKISRLASGSVEVRRGDTVLLSCASRDDNLAKSGDGYSDFVPLSVEYNERFSSAGLTSGSFNKRDGRPSDLEILTCRLIDRPIRPLFNKNWKYETQLLSWVLSYDSISSCSPLAITGSATALYISDIPFPKPVAAVEVGLVPVPTPDNDNTDSEQQDQVMNADGNTTKKKKQQYYKLVINPTREQSLVSPLQLTVAGTIDGILMIEGAANFLPESIFIQAIQFGHRAIQTLCTGIVEFGVVAGKNKWSPPLTSSTSSLNQQQQPSIYELQQVVNEYYTEMVDNYYSLKGSKKQKGIAMGQLYDSIGTDQRIATRFPDCTVPINSSMIQYALKQLLIQRMYHQVKTIGVRDDGRTINQIRRIDIETSILPKVHGSALFTRGETQTIATATLGDSSMRQKIDTINGMDEKAFYLQYNFPPSSVGETGRVGTPGRREIGHGNLAERALIPILPTEQQFPYTIRLESLITESHGSSSMASVCGGCLALMDAGVPIKTTVAGIAMGMLLEESATIANDDTAIVLSDITGTEDALGTMDFKVAGNMYGITTFQLDIKCEGLTISTMSKALEQARIGRIHILNEMSSKSGFINNQPRTTLPNTVPKISSFTIPNDSIGKVIGPGGKQIRAIIEDFNLINMDINDNGVIQLTSYDIERIQKAEEFVKTLIGGGGGSSGRGDRNGASGGGSSRVPFNGPEPEIGTVFTGKITGVHQFGVFIEIIPPVVVPESNESDELVNSDNDEPSLPPGTIISGGLEGLCHVSELARERIRNCEGFVTSLGVSEMTVKYIGKDAKGKLKLSRKAILDDEKKKTTMKQQSSPPSTMVVGSTNDGTKRTYRSNNNNSVDSTTTTSSESDNDSAAAKAIAKKELDIIAQAIEGL